VIYGVAMSRDGGASGLAPEAASQKLVRREFSAEETFRRLRQLMENGRPLVGEGDWEALSEWRDDATVATTGVVAHDVVRFEARPFADLQAPRAVFAEPAWVLPRWLDVTLRVTNRQTGQMLRTAPDWRGAGEKAAALLNGTPEVYDDDAEVKTYTLRLRMPSPAT
jgi:hypothetical protein